MISQELIDMINRLEDHYNRYGNGGLENQLIKIQEELGEASAAYIGWSGSNPRKGTTHNRHDIALELADVMVTAALGIVYTGHAVNTVLAQQMKKSIARLDEYDAGR